MVANHLMDKVVETGIDYKARSMEKPSDHCPIWVDLKL
jgi:exodeoxyribonuclease-3